MVVQKLDSSTEPIECGAAAAQHFLFDKGYLNLNHGSFGAVPKAIRDVQRHYQDACERQPDVWIRYIYPGLLASSRAAIASYLSAPTSSVVYVQNATTALNVVLRDLRFKEGDVAIYFSTIYSAIEKTLLYLSETTPLRLHRVELVYPVSDAAVISAFQSAITAVKAQGKTPKLAIIDTISSLPGVRVPFESLIRLCRDHGLFSVVDAAHGAGHIPLDLTALDPDFLTTNLHKWLHVPRPCAVLHVPERNQHLIRSSLPTSHGFVPNVPGARINNPLPGTGAKLSVYEVNFEFIGTLDNTAFLCVEPALRWRERLTWNGMRGEEAIMGYCHAQAREAAGKVVAGILGTEMMANEDDTLGCCMSNVWLPLEYGELFDGELDYDNIVKVARWIEEQLVKEHRTFVAVIYHGTAWMVRLSAQVYLTMDDWENAGRWLKIVCDRAKEKKWS